jgi:hypothetical protein
MPTKFRYALGATLWLTTLPIRALSLIMPTKNTVDWEGERRVIFERICIVGEAAALAMRTNINTNKQL